MALSIDIETLDTKPTAVILSIGAVVFDPEAKKLRGGVLWNIDAAAQFTRTISEDTVRWWLKSPALLAETIDCEVVSLAHALYTLEGLWTGRINQQVWFNGTDFDGGILADAYRTELRSEPPWQYYQQHDVRTLKKFVPRNCYGKRKRPDGEAHNALWDAQNQAITVQEIHAWRKKVTDAA